LTTTVAVSDLLASARLVARIVTVCGELTVSGDVYTPADEIVPSAGETVQLTLVSLAQLTVAANWSCLSPAMTVPFFGETATMIAGITETSNCRETPLELADTRTLVAAVAELTCSGNTADADPAGTFTDVGMDTAAPDAV
jgi:hypothetical protein